MSSLERGYFVPSDMSEAGRRGKLTTENIDQQFKRQIRERVVELIIERGEIGYKQDPTVLNRFARSELRYRLPFIFYVAKSLLKGEDPLDFEEWDWENYWRKADYNVDAHTVNRWKSQRNHLFRNHPSLLKPLTLNWELKRRGLSYSEWDRLHDPKRAEGVTQRGFYQI